MPRSKYIKEDNSSNRQKGPSRGLFDLPDGSKKDVFKKENSRKLNKVNGNRTVGFYDLPSGAGKKQAIQKQQELYKARELERQGAIKDESKKNNNAMIFGYGSGSMSSPYIKPSKNSEENQNKMNLEKNFSKSSAFMYYYKEIGYYLKPILIYAFATLVYVALGAFGFLNGIDLRYACFAVYGIILFILGISVNRHMSLPGFVILFLVNVVGGIVGQTGLISKLSVAGSRLIKLLNIPYFVFDTQSTKLNSVFLIFSLIVPLLLVYLGSKLHRYTYAVKAKLKNKNIQQEKDDMLLSANDVVEKIEMPNVAQNNVEDIN